VSGHKYYTIIIRNVETGVIEKTLQGDNQFACSVEYSPEGNKIAAGFIIGKIII
jgi:hypothetical protein